MIVIDYECFETLLGNGDNLVTTFSSVLTRYSKSSLFQDHLNLRLPNVKIKIDVSIATNMWVDCIIINSHLQNNLYTFKRSDLTLYHTSPTFNDTKEEGFGKHYGKRRKCW